MNKKMLIIGTAILLLFVGFSGCIDESIDESEDIETIMISGVDTTRTVHYLDKPVKLMVSGVGNDVTVTKETNLVDIMLSGVECIVRVSRSHSFTSMISGVGSEIIFYD